MTKDNGEVRKCFIIPPQQESWYFLFELAKRGFCRPLLAVQKMLRKCLQRLGLCYQWQGKSVRKIFNTQSSIFQVYVTGIILTSAVTCSPTFLFLKHIKVALDLNIYCMKIFPQLKELCCHSWWWSTELRLFFKLVETPPVMGSLKLSLVPHSVREGRQFVVNSITVLV